MLTVDTETVPVNTFITTKISFIEVYNLEKLEFKSKTLSNGSRIKA